MASPRITYSITLSSRIVLTDLLFESLVSVLKYQGWGEIMITLREVNINGLWWKGITRNERKSVENMQKFDKILDKIHIYNTRNR